MNQAFANLHGADFDLCVVGGTLFACAVAREAAACGVRTLLLAPGDVAESAAGRSVLWLPALVDAGAATDAAAAQADREALLRVVPHAVRPVRLLVTPGDRRVAVAARNAGSTLPKATAIDAASALRAFPFLAADAAQQATLAFDALLDVAALARALARDAVCAGAVVRTHAQVVGASVEGLEAESAGARARVRAAEVLVTQGFAAAGAALHVDLTPRLVPHDEVVVAAACAHPDIALALRCAGGWLTVGPGGSSQVASWRSAAAGAVADATVAAVQAALGARADMEHAVVRRLLPTARIEEATVVGRLHAQHVEPVVAMSAARAFVRRVFPERAASAPPAATRPLGAQEPLDPVWRRHGGEAIDIRRLARADAALARAICPHRGLIGAEIVHAAGHDSASTFADVLRRVALPDPCADPDCLRRTLAAYRRLRDIDDATATAALRALLDPIARCGRDADAPLRGEGIAGIVGA